MEKNPQEAAKVLADTLQFDEKYASKALEDMMPGFDKKGKIDPKGIEFFLEDYRCHGGCRQSLA